MVQHRRVCDRDPAQGLRKEVQMFYHRATLLLTGAIRQIHISSDPTTRRQNI